MKTSPHHSLACLLAAGFLAFSAANLPAATRAKANNPDNLNLGSSWTNNLIPGSADVALFDSTVTSPVTLALGTDLAWNQINFVNPGGDVTLSAGSTLTLSNNTPVAFGTGTANLTLDCSVVCAGVSFATLASAPTGRTLTYGGIIQGRNTTVTLGNTTGTLRLGSPNSTLLGSPVQVTGTGVRLGIGASSVGDPIASGPLGTNLFTWNSSTASELFTYNGGQTLGNPIRIQSSPLNFNSDDALTFTGVADLNAGNRTFNVTSNGVLRFTGTISNATGLTKIGPGTLELGGTNVATFANGLSIFGGTVRLLANNVIPDGGSAGALRMTNTTEVLDLNGFSDIVRGVTGSGGSGNWGGTLDNTAPNTTSTLTLGDNFQYTIAGMVQNSGLNAKLALVKIGTGGLILTNARTFSGGITNASASQIFINSPGAAGTGPITLAHTNSELTYSGGGSTTWTNDIILAANTQPVLSANDGNTLEIAGVISGPGVLRRDAAFGKQGPLAYSGDNSFAGGFVLAGGMVTLNHPRAIGRGLFSIGDPAFFAGASLVIVPGVNLSGANALTNSILINRDFTIGGTNAIEFAGPVVWITNSTQRSINVTNPAGIVISAPMSGYGFNKNGSGLLTFNSVCSHNGPSTVSSGPLALGPLGEFTGVTTILVGGGGSFDVSAVTGFVVKPTQALRVENGSRVSGHVTINGALTNNALFGPAIFSNNLALATGSTSVFTINRFNQTGTNLLCLGSLTFGGQLIVNNFSGALQAGDTFKLFAFSGNPGSFANLTLPALDPGLAWNTSNLAVDGTISVVSTAAAQPLLANPLLPTPSNFVMTVTGGATNGQFRVLTQTNVAEPMANWTAISTNTYDGNGSLTVTNAVSPAEPQRFFRAVQP
jgi:hypothetical protein